MNLALPRDLHPAALPSGGPVCCGLALQPFTCSPHYQTPSSPPRVHGEPGHLQIIQTFLPPLLLVLRDGLLTQAGLGCPSSSWPGHGNVRESSGLSRVPASPPREWQEVRGGRFCGLPGSLGIGRREQPQSLTVLTMMPLPVPWSTLVGSSCHICSK